MVQVEIKVDDHGLADELRSKASEVDREFQKFTKKLVDIAHRWVQNDAPRKTGKLKASIKKQSNGTQGYVWQEKGIAKYGDFVIDGTRPHFIAAKHKKALNVPGFGIFKSVHHPGTKGNPFFDRAINDMDPEINQAVSVFEKWLTEV